MYGTDSALSEPSMDASLLVAPLAASETMQRLVAWRQALPGATAAAAEHCFWCKATRTSCSRDRYVIVIVIVI
jgi:hypothetical protein